MVGYCADCHKPAYQTPSGSCCENGHGGADVIEELPVCTSCGASLGPNSQFCSNCGENCGVPADDESKAESECPACGSVVSANARFCSDCGKSLVGEEQSDDEDANTDKMAVKAEAEDKPKRTVKKPVKDEDNKPNRTVKAPSPNTDDDTDDDVDNDDDDSPSFDVSQIDPRETWECFGDMYEEGDVECDNCPFRKECAEEAADN